MKRVLVMAAAGLAARNANPSTNAANSGMRLKVVRLPTRRRNGSIGMLLKRPRKAL